MVKIHSPFIWYNKAVLLTGLSSQEPSEPSVELEQSAMLDSSESSLELETAGEGN